MINPEPPDLWGLLFFLFGLLSKKSLKGSSKKKGEFSLELSSLSSSVNSFSDKIFFIDETYYGFGHYTFIPLIKKHKNIFICRSASKTFGLASLRVGSLIAHEDSIKPFISFAPVYKLNIFSAKIMEYFLKRLN